MSQQNDEEVVLRNYLLGNLDEAGQEEVEERLLCDDSFAEKLSAAQDDLIDDHVFDALPVQERERFEKNFILTDERRKKILFAQTLEIYVDKNYEYQHPSVTDSQPPSPWWRNSLLFLRSHKAWSVIVLATAVLLVFLTPRLMIWLKSNGQDPRLQARRASIENQIAELNKRPTDPVFQNLSLQELALQPTRLREEGGIKQVVLTEGTKLLSLRLALPPIQYESYGALVLTADDDKLFAIKDLAPASDSAEAAILLKIPSEFLTTGDYQIQLQGNAADGQTVEAARYSFRVIKNAQRQ